MFPSFAHRMLGATLPAILTLSGLASPRSSKLLPLVPPGAQVVAGFENPHRGHTGGRLLLSTTTNRLDLDDWLALAGVDTKRVFDEVIEVSTTTRGGELRDHLLLVAGRFDRERIFGAAGQNGAQTAVYDAEPILIVKPFPREQQRMLDTRWLAVLDNRVAIMGTPSMVQQALQRYQTHAVADSILDERLSQLRSDVNSWNVLVAAPDAPRNLVFARAHSEWARVMEGADVLMVAAHFGLKVRVDFSLHARDDRGAAYFTEKAAQFSEVFVLTPDDSSPTAIPASRVENVAVETGHVSGSIALSQKQFKDWVVRLSLLRAPQAPAPVGVAHGN